MGHYARTERPKTFVAAAGAIGLFAVRVRPPVILSGNFADVEELDGSASPRFVVHSLNPMGRRSTLSALHQKSMGSNPSVFPPASSTKGNGRSASKGLQEVSTTEHATLAGQQENLLRPGEWCARASQLQNNWRVKRFRIRKPVSDCIGCVDFLTLPVTVKRKS